MMEIKNILFVCTGNTCRSYMAEIMAREYLHNKKRDSGVSIISAGTGCLGGEPATREARTVLAELGYQDTDHGARELNEELITKADLILTMTELQRNQILRDFPQARKKTFLLKKFAWGEENPAGEKKPKHPLAYDVADPFGQSLEYYRDCGKELKEAVERAMAKLSSVKSL